jgi:hypothetical protein
MGSGAVAVGSGAGAGATGRVGGALAVRSAAFSGFASTFFVAFAEALSAGVTTSSVS